MPEINSLEAAKRALEAQEKRRTPEQQRHYEWVAKRAERIQQVGPRPVDGVTFGKGKVPKADG